MDDRSGLDTGFIHHCDQVVDVLDGFRKYERGSSSFGVGLVILQDLFVESLSFRDLFNFLKGEFIKDLGGRSWGTNHSIAWYD